MCLAVLFGCEKREDFPPKLDIIPPPSVANFQVVKVDTVLGFLDVFELNWDLADTTVVDHYKIYALVGFTADYIDDSDGPPQEVTTLATEGLVFGVSSVTFQNVEGNPAFALAPDTITTTIK
jgi:hypothetical protein